MLSAVNALRAIRESLTDPFQNLKNWKRGDPCTSSWTGIFCYNITPDDGFLHVRELYEILFMLHPTILIDIKLLNI